MMDAFEGLPLTGKGMFAWFHVPEESLPSFRAALVNAKVLVMPGEAFGETRPGWFRMSMGHHDDHTYRALTALASAFGAL
jgi:aspartate/methionine/tyrosine aminotransferase